LPLFPKVRQLIADYYPEHGNTLPHQRKIFAEN
jgi:hypothetical protein